MSKRDDFMMAVLEHSTIAAAAHAAGVSERQASRYMADKAFTDELQQRRGEMLDRLCDVLMSSQQKAVAVMMELMTDRQSRDTVRLSAARSVIEYALKAKDLCVRIEDGKLRREMSGNGCSVTIIDDINDGIMSLADLIKNPVPDTDIDELV